LRYEGGADARDNAAASAPANAATTVAYDRAVAVDVDGNSKGTPESRRSSVDPGSSCPEGMTFALFYFVFFYLSSEVTKFVLSEEQEISVGIGGLYGVSILM
jgi:hypothetical protein